MSTVGSDNEKCCYITRYEISTSYIFKCMHLSVLPHTWDTDYNNVVYHIRKVSLPNLSRYISLCHSIIFKYNLHRFYF